MNQIRITLIAAFLLIAMCFFRQVSAQTWLENLPKDKVESGTLSFYDMQKAFNDYWEPHNVIGGKYINNKGVEVKAPGWKQFKRWEYYWETRVNPNTGEFPKTTAWEELQKFQSDYPGSTKSTAGNWTSLGPSASPGGYAGLGRINCVAFHPTDINTVYTGAPSGGLWKTTDGGASWTVLSDTWAVQGCSDICVVPGSPNIVYAATGDRENTMWHFGGGQNHDNNSVGVLISTNAGATWSSTGLSFAISERKAINRLLIDPSNSNILYAATTSGVYKTTDAGENWTLIYATQFSDMEFQPGTPSTIYGSSKAGDIYQSTDSGGSWTATLTTTFGRVEMAVTPANTNIVYAVMQDTPGQTNDESPVYKSVDGGGSFTRVFTSSTLNLFGYDCDGSDMDGTQASYDLCIASDPNNANVVFIGGVNTYKSTNGGSSWSISTHWSSSCSGIATKVHADQHCLAYQPVSNHLFLGNDGGLYKTSNSGTLWTYIGSGLVTTQIYRIGVAQSVANECILGAQDNGSKAYSSGNWSDVAGGDGGECIFDYSDQNIMYASSQNGSFQRSTNHGGSFTNITAGLTGDPRFIAPLAIDPTVPTTIYCAYSDVWKSTNQGTAWTKISNWGNAEISHIAIAPSNSQYIYATTQTILYRTTDGGTSWSNITGSLPVGSSLITYVSVKSDDPNTVWVSMGTYTANRVYQTTDGGSTWTSISSGLPNIPVMCVIQNKQNTSAVELYAGTDVGVYVKVGAASWQLFSTNLPVLVVNELEIYYDDNTGNSKLYAGTYGRGMWVSDLYESGVLNPTNFTATASSNTQIDLSWALTSGNDVMLAYNTTPTFGTPVNGTTYTTTIPGGGTVLYNGSNTTFNHTALSQNTTYYYKIWSKDGSTTYSTGVTADASTFCTLISSFPWIEGFEHAGAMPDCWTQQYIDGANPWQMQTTGTNNHPAAAHTGTYLARNRTTTSGAGYVTKFITPALNLTLVSSPFLTFWHTQDFWSPSQDEMRVYYKTSTNGSWNLLATYSSSIASWTRETIALPNASPAYFIAFESTVNAGYGVCLDDIMISSPVADFTVDGNVSCSGSLSVNFTDNSIGHNGSWTWDVDNNGTTDYTTQNPTHTYSSPGLFTVKLAINNGSASLVKENHILVMNSEPTVNTGCTLASNSNNGNAYGIGIYRFALGNIDYTTSHNNGYYQNYSCSKWTPLELNKSYNITIRTGTANNEGARVYIDYNDNGTFESGESVVSFPSNKDGTRTLSFTTPSSGVTLDKGLRLRVLSELGSIPSTACDIATYGQAEDYTVYFTGDASWTGNASSAWATPGNWDINSVPISGAKIKIPSGAPNYPILTSDVTCKDLTIMEDASLTINPGKALTVSSLFTNNAGNSGLVIKSDATGTGSLIHSNSGLQAILERYVGAYANAETGWHLISSPIENQEISGDWSPSSSVYDFYAFDESLTDGYWLNQKVPANNMTHFIPGKGYLVAYESTAVKTFEGAVNVTGLTLNGLTNTPSGSYAGWHLVGNPFASAIDWNSGSWTKTNIDGIMQVWNSSTASYQTSVEVGGIIPAMNGFMVHTSGAGTLSMPSDARVHNTTNWYKSEDDFLLLKLNDEEVNTSQSSILRFNEMATEGFDNEYDFYFLAGFAPMFYSRSGSGFYSLNTLPQLSKETVVPFDFTGNGASSYSLELAKSLTGTIVYLTDLKTNNVVNLTENQQYHFTANEGDLSGRFLISFGSVGLNEAELSGLSIYAHRDIIFVKGVEKGSQILISNLQGQLLLKTISADDGVEIVNAAQLAGGIYVVSVVGEQGVVSRRVMVVK
ncbi:MAG: PKD domain-containing protein [Bacteroidales bacterium]|nr:PKD domain-containing protein [Bacteroidales bacterium]